jgi:hypothetical protein
VARVRDEGEGAGDDAEGGFSENEREIEPYADGEGRAEVRGGVMVSVVMMMMMSMPRSLRSRDLGVIMGMPGRIAVVGVVMMAMRVVAPRSLRHRPKVSAGLPVGEI